MSANNTSGAFHHVFRSLAAGQQQPRDEPSTAGAEAAPDLNANDAPQASETTGQIPLNNAQMDVDMPAAVDGANYDSDDSMPALRDVDDSDDSDEEFSGSDSEMDADELEVQLQTVRDQQDSQDADVAGPSTHSAVTSGISSPSRNNRRSRGQHDGDEDRDRRHPSQRTGSESTGGSTPRRTFLHPPHHNAAPHPAPAPTQFPPPPNVNPQPTHTAQAPRTQNLMRLLGFTIDLPTGHVHPLPPTGLAAGAFPPAGAFPLNFPGEVGDLFARLGMAGSLLSEQEDPERAKQLVDGLEEVPIGLVRRLERVGNLAGTDASGTGGDCGCAICWDRLLDGDGNQFGDGQESSSSEGMAVDSAATASDANSAESKSSEQTHPKIVALPCSHVFHASCLIPWFSRPRQTTCPTCRFNIDPENLTYRRRRRTPPPANTTDAPANPQTAEMPSVPNTNPTIPTPAPNAASTTIPSSNIPNAIPTPQQPAPPPAGFRMNLGAPFGAALLGEFFRAMNAQAAHDAAAHPPPPGAAPQPPTNGPVPPPTQPDMGVPGEQPQAENFEFNAGVVIDLLSMFTGAGVPAQNAAPAPPSTQPAAANAPPAQTTPSTQVPATQTPDDDDELPGLEPIDLPMAPEPPAAGQPPPPHPHGHTNPHIENDGDNTFVTLGFDMFIGTGPPPTFGPDDEGEVFDFFQGGVVPDAPNGAAGQPQAGPGAGPNIFGAGAAPFATGRTMEELLSNLTNRLGVQFPPGHAHQPPQPHPQPQHFQPQPVPPPRPRSAPPPQQEQQAQPNVHAQHTHAFGLGPLPHFQIPPIHVGHAPPPPQSNDAAGGPQPDPNPQLPHFAQFLSGAGIPGDMGAMPFLDPRAARQFRRPPRERKKWTLPAAPGPTLRQRVERKEREANLRCHDMSCGVGPSDEEPDAVVNESQIHIIRGVDGANVCSHTFHPSCLVTSQRVALKGLEESVNGDCVEVSCPVCRADGLISKVDWDAGAAV